MTPEQQVLVAHLRTIIDNGEFLPFPEHAISRLLDILDAVRTERDDLAAAYAAMQKENLKQASDLDSWNLCAGWMLNENAEGR